MNDTTIAVLASTVAAAIAAIPPTLVALASLRASQRNAVKADTILDASQQVASKADTIIEKAVEIHTLTNSNLAKVTAELQNANTKIEGLQHIMEEMNIAKKDAKELADKQVIPPKS